MNSPVIFAGALTIFAGALPPWAHPGDGVDGVTVRLFADDLKMYAQILKPVDADVLQIALNRLFTLSQKKTNCYPLTHHT